MRWIIIAKILNFLAQRLAEEEKQLPQDKRSELGLMEKLEFVLNNAFERITYTEAIDILLKALIIKRKNFSTMLNGELICKANMNVIW